MSASLIGEFGRTLRRFEEPKLQMAPKPGQTIGVMLTRISHTWRDCNEPLNLLPLLPAVLSGPGFS